jgi:hypothetical protein
MANGAFVSFRNALWTSDGPDFENGTIKVSAIDAADVTIDLATHDFYNDVSAGEVAVATLSGITVGTVSDGTLDAADTLLASVSGDTFENLVVWEDTGGAASTDPLCLFFDTVSGGSPLSVPPNGGDITVSWAGSGIATI